MILELLGGLVLGGSASAFVASGTIGRSLERRTVRRSIRATPDLTSSSRDGAWVRITGVVRPPGFYANGVLTGVDGVIARTRTWGGRFSNAPYESFTTVPFEVETADGIVTVEARYAKLAVPALSFRTHRIDHNWRRRLLIEHGISDGAMYRWRFEEIVVVPGMQIELAGQLARDAGRMPSDEERGFRDAQAARVRIGGTLEKPVLVAALRPQ